MRPTDVDRLYHYLAIFGPRTLAEIRLWMNWTTYRTNRALTRLQRAGDVRMIERNTIQVRHRHGFRYCGKYEAVTAGEVAEKKHCELREAIGA